MSLLGYVRILERGYYDLIRAIRIYSNQSYENSLMSIGRENIFTGKSEGFDSSNCLQRKLYEERCKGRGCQHQKALLKRINEEIKGLEIKIEENIQNAFLMDAKKSRRWCKRHHISL